MVKVYVKKSKRQIFGDGVFTVIIMSHNRKNKLFCMLQACDKLLYLITGH
jgi:hypothetical protein